VRNEERGPRGGETPRYDAIGAGYARFRSEDPRLAALVRAALGEARSVVNVGAGAGSYEPADLYVIAIEPSDTMAAQWLGGRVSVETVPIPRDTPDWTLGSYWAHPERVLDAGARAATSGFARMPAEVVARVARDVERDLADGTWDRRHGGLRELDEFDAGLRLVVSWPR
jgi:hypothetical protein